VQLEALGGAGALARAEAPASASGSGTRASRAVRDAHLAFAGSDTTHHDNYGSYELAKCVVEGVRQAKLPIARSLLDMPPFDPAHPDPVSKFDIPAEPAADAQRPYGQ
jgi:hypothetical protein